MLHKLQQTTTAFRPTSTHPNNSYARRCACSAIAPTVVLATVCLLFDTQLMNDLENAVTVRDLLFFSTSVLSFFSHCCNTLVHVWELVVYDSINNLNNVDFGRQHGTELVSFAKSIYCLPIKKRRW